MKLKRLLQKVETFLSAEERERRSRRDEMREVLAKLKKKARKLEAELAAEDDPEGRARLERKLTVAHAQRRKGIAALKALKKQRGTRRTDELAVAENNDPQPGD